MELCRIFDEFTLTRIQLPVVIIVLKASKQYLGCVSHSIIHDAEQTLLFFGKQILVVGKVGQVLLSLIDEEVSSVPSVFTRHVQQWAMLSRFNEACPVEQVLWVNLFFWLREVDKEGIMWV